MVTSSLDVSRGFESGNCSAVLSTIPPHCLPSTNSILKKLLAPVNLSSFVIKWGQIVESSSESSGDATKYNACEGLSRGPIVQLNGQVF